MLFARMCLLFASLRFSCHLLYFVLFVLSHFLCGRKKHTPNTDIFYMCCDYCGIFSIFARISVFKSQHWIYGWFGCDWWKALLCRNQNMIYERLGVPLFGQDNNDNDVTDCNPATPKYFQILNRNQPKSIRIFGWNIVGSNCCLHISIKVMRIWRQKNECLAVPWTFFSRKKPQSFSVKSILCDL